MNSVISFSVVVPVYNAEPYLGDLFASLDSQVDGPFTLECIFVDDGSTDSSRELISDWLRLTRHAGKLLVQSNNGVSSARNRGLAAATGEWVGFPDSDDFLGARYFESIARELLRDSRAPVDLVSANVVRYFEAAGVLDRAHPLSFKFRGGSTVRNIQLEPTAIQTQAASAMFRRSVLAENDLCFIVGLHAAEDALFVARYLFHGGGQTMLCVAEAEYVYRRRASGDSAVDRFKFSSDFYFDRFTRGYIPLLRDAQQRCGVPRWLANMFLYDLRWFLPREETQFNRADHLDPREKQKIVHIVSSALQFVSDEAIAKYDVTELSAQVRNLLFALKGSALPDAGRAKITNTSRLGAELRYMTTDSRPDEVISSGSRIVDPVATKTRSLDYFGQQVLVERILRLTTRESVRLFVDGIELPIADGEYVYPLPLSTSLRSQIPPAPGGVSARRSLAARITRRLTTELACWRPGLVKDQDCHRRGMALRESRHTSYVRSVALLPKYAQRYGGAWAFVDEDGEGSAWALFEDVSRRFPHINCWYIARGDDLTSVAFHEHRTRIVARDSLHHKLLLIHASAVVSSSVSLDVVKRIPERYYGSRRQWVLVFVPGPIVFDSKLALLMDSAQIDLMLAEDRETAKSILADRSPFSLTSDSIVVLEQDGTETADGEERASSRGSRSRVPREPEEPPQQERPTRRAVSAIENVISKGRPLM